MAMSSGGGEGGGAMADINVTPLVDVMLVLLIIFMITTPLMQHKIQVKLPEANLDKKESNMQVPPITIAVTDSGGLYLNDEPTTRDQLETFLATEAQKMPQPQVNVRGDKTTKYRAIQDVVMLAQLQGMRKVGFVSIADRSGR